MDLKKRLIAIIFAVMMLLSGCSMPTGEPIVTAQDVGGSAGLVYSGEIGPEPEQTEEIKLPHKPTPGQNASLISGKECFTEFEPGNYLADAKFDTDEYLPEFDTDNTFLHCLEENCGICETEDAWYFCREFMGTPMLEGGSIIYKYDKKTGVSAPLCPKPDCNHRSKGCCAFLEGATEPCGLTVYDGELFVATPDFRGGRDMGRVFSISLDGSERKEVRTLPNEEAKGFFPNSNRIMTIHRGYVYMLERGYAADNAGYIGVWYIKLSALPLNGGDDFTIFYLGSPYITSFNCSMEFCGNDVYFLVDGHPRLNYYGIYRWNSKTRESEVIIESYKKNEGCGKNFAVIPEDAIYFLTEHSEDDGGGSDIMKYSFSDKSISVLPISVEGGASVLFCSDSIAKVSNYKNSATIYGYDGEVKANIEFEDVGRPFAFDGEKIYFFREDELSYDIVSLGKETVRIDG